MTMASNNEQNYLENLPDSVKYNDGFFSVLRMHDIKRKINSCKINPTAFNFNENIWNYELWINCIEMILDEIWFKLSGDEREEISEYQDSINKFMSECVIVEVKTQTVYPYKKNEVVNKTKWLKIKKLIVNYDRLVRDYMDKYGFGNPDGGTEEDDY